MLVKGLMFRELNFLSRGPLLQVISFSLCGNGSCFCTKPYKYSCYYTGISTAAIILELVQLLLYWN